RLVTGDRRLDGLEAPREGPGLEPPPAGVELEVDVERSPERRDIEQAGDRVAVGVHPVVAEHHGESGRTALIGVLGNERDGRDEVGPAQVRMRPHRAQPGGRAPHRPARSEQEQHAKGLKPAQHQPYYTSGSTMEPSATVHTCWVCGAIMREIKCKIVCPHCGYTRDCSDP